MANLNLQALIDQVLGITQEAWGMKKRKLDEGLSGHEQTQLRNNKIDDELLKQRGALELQKQGNEASYARQGLANTGALDQAKERTAGEIARQGMANEASRYTADQGLQGHMYTADTNYAMKRDELAKGYDPELIKAHAAIIANVNSTPEAVASSQAAIDWYTQKTKNKGSQARQGLAEEAPAAIPASTPPAASIPMPQPKNNSLGDAAVSDIMNKNLPDDFSNFRTPTAPQNTTPSTPATGLGGSIGRGWYGFTHPDEPTPMTRAESPFRKASDKFVFDTAPKAVANTAIGAVKGVQDFGSNTVLGYEQRKAEEEAKKKRKALY
jgi:hypothetical protein